MSQDSAGSVSVQRAAEYQWREMRSADLTAVLKIERDAQISPWSRLSFEESLNREHHCRVLELGEQIVAYHVVCAVADELHVLNVVVAKQAQGQGLAHLLLADVIELAERGKLKRIFLEVRASNTVAQSLYRKWEFKQIAERKNYYSATQASGGEREDALIFMRHTQSAGLAV